MKKTSRLKLKASLRALEYGNVTHYLFADVGLPSGREGAAEFIGLAGGAKLYDGPDLRGDYSNERSGKRLGWHDLALMQKPVTCILPAASVGEENYAEPLRAEAGADGVSVWLSFWLRQLSQAEQFS